MHSGPLHCILLSRRDQKVVDDAGDRRVEIAWN